MALRADTGHVFSELWSSAGEEARLRRISVYLYSRCRDVPGVWATMQATPLHTVGARCCRRFRDSLGSVSSHGRVCLNWLQPHLYRSSWLPSVPAHQAPFQRPGQTLQGSQFLCLQLLILSTWQVRTLQRSHRAGLVTCFRF